MEMGNYDSKGDSISDVEPPSIKSNIDYKPPDIYSLDKGIKKGGPRLCPCGSGKPPEECCFKHLRPDKNPFATAQEFKIELINKPVDEYATPQSFKEYEVGVEKEVDKKEEEIVKEVEDEFEMEDEKEKEMLLQKMKDTMATPDEPQEEVEDDDFFLSEL